MLIDIRASRKSLWKDGWKESDPGDGKGLGWWMTSKTEAVTQR